MHSGGSEKTGSSRAAISFGVTHGTAPFQYSGRSRLGVPPEIMSQQVPRGRLRHPDGRDDLTPESPQVYLSRAGCRFLASSCARGSPSADRIPPPHMPAPCSGRSTDRIGSLAARSPGRQTPSQSGPRSRPRQPGSVARPRAPRVDRSHPPVRACRRASNRRPECRRRTLRRCGRPW